MDHRHRNAPGSARLRRHRLLASRRARARHALAVVFPAQTAFLSSLVRRRLARRGRAAGSRVAFAFALFALNLARAIGASAPEVCAGAPRAGRHSRALDVVETLVDVLVALARAAAGITLALAGAETNGAVGSRQELFLSICWCVSVLALAPPQWVQWVPGRRGRAASWLGDALRRRREGFRIG